MNLQNLQIYSYKFEDFSYIFEQNFSRKITYMLNEESHISVLLNESIEQLNPQDGKVYLDCTFGAGGHSRAILEKANCKVIALDRDSHTKQFADLLKEEFGERFIYINSKFSDLDEALQTAGINEVDGVLFDIGVSSMQIDTPRRGFSFQEDGPLDMRMSDEGISAEDFINEAKEEEIAGVIFRYGDERKSRQIASAIIRERTKKRITRTSQLANIILSVLGRSRDGIHPATRTFQAIRIYINDELNELKIALQKATKIIKDEGRVCVITFHSGEDVIVKDFFREISGYNQGVSRYLPSLEMQANHQFSDFELLTKKPILPNDFEIKNNIRARSAKLRVLQKKKKGLIH